MAEPILEFDAVTVEGGHPYDAAIYDVSFRLGAGELGWSIWRNRTFGFRWRMRRRGWWNRWRGACAWTVRIGGGFRGPRLRRCGRASGGCLMIRAG